MNLYSQYGEDRQITNIVRECERRRLLDIGAYHPTCFSNSRALLEAGWAGLLIEPSPEPFLTLLKAYSEWKDVDLINAAVVPAPPASLIRFHATADAVSTSDEIVRERWAKAGGYYGAYWAQTITVPDLAGQFGVEFDFINIDTEGSSVDVFGAVIRAGFRPKCFCVEHDDRIAESNRFASSAGYRQVLLNGTNVLYAR